MSFKPGKFRKLIKNLHKHRAELQQAESSEKEENSENNVVSIEKAPSRKRIRNKKKKKKKKKIDLIKLKKKKKEIRNQQKKDLKESIATIQELVAISRDQLAKFRFSFRHSTPLEETYAREYIKAMNNLIETYLDILTALNKVDLDVIESSFNIIQERKKEIQQTDIFKREIEEKNQDLENLRIACLDIIEKKEEEEETDLLPLLENLEKHIDSMDESNKKEFGKIEDPDSQIKEMFNMFDGYVDKYREALETIKAYREDNEKEKIITGLLLLKKAGDGIEDMLDS